MQHYWHLNSRKWGVSKKVSGYSSASAVSVSNWILSMPWSDLLLTAPQVGVFLLVCCKISLYSESSLPTSKPTTGQGMDH